MRWTAKIEVFAWAGGMCKFPPLSFLFSDEGSVSLAAVAGMNFILRRFGFNLHLIVRFEEFTGLVLVVEAFGLCSKAFLLVLFVDDGLVVGGNAANGKFAEGIFDAAFVDFATEESDAFVAEVEGVGVGLGGFGWGFFFHRKKNNGNIILFLI